MFASDLNFDDQEHYYRRQLSLNPADPASRNLRFALMDYLDLMEGFENWRLSTFAERLLDDPASVMEAASGDAHLYVLMGECIDRFYSILIDWTPGKQPRIHSQRWKPARRR